ncbi:hypothetical protein J2X14_003798 [Pantoea alhagi]|nr:hypothetical protein [Pantoea alhagi]
MLASLPGNAADGEYGLRLDGQDFVARGAAYVVRLDGTTCLLLNLQDGATKTLSGDALQVADWYQACLHAGLPVRVQVNPDTPLPSPENGAP